VAQFAGGAVGAVGAGASGGDVLCTGGAGGDVLCAALYAGGCWGVGSVSGFRNFHCGSFLFTVRHPSLHSTDQPTFQQ